MTTSRELTGMDRAFRLMARVVERPTLRFVGHQPLLRRIFAVSSRLGQSRPKGVRVRSEPDGSLWFHPDGAAPEAAPLLYFHGGGFTIGSPQTHGALVGHLAQKAGRPALSARYRLAPEHPFPAARDDAIAAYKRLVDAGQPPFAIGGDSAGGCLALQVAQAARDAGWPMPKALVLIAPVADLSGGIAERFGAAKDEILIPPAWPRRLLRDYLPGIDPAMPEVSPLQGDLTGLPPTLIQVGDGEALLADANRLVAAMDDATLDVWPGLQHVWHLHAGRAPAADKAISAMADFLRGFD